MRFLLSNLLVVGCLVSPAAAADFSSLLDDLSFDSAPVPSYAATKQPVAKAEPAAPEPTHGFRLPSIDKVAPESSQARLLAPIAAAPKVENKLSGADEALSAMAANAGRVQSTKVGHFLGLGKKDAACDSGCDAPVPAKAPCESCVVLPPDTDCGCRVKRHEAVCETHQEADYCPPRDPVNLPSSTLLQFFRSNRCNTNVWDGYSQKCGGHFKHINGDCDCLKKKPRKRCLGGQCGEILDPVCPTGGCDECDGRKSIWEH